jgi:FtsP/CotA-like multicopper oxidase with cupredoxin domain
MKDTVLVPGQEMVEIEAYLDNPGHWMLHCHILEHAELGMMAELVVEPPEE